MSRVLVVSNDVVGERMAGPGIRAWEFARVLAQHHEVLLAAPSGEAGWAGQVHLLPHRALSAELVGSCDVCVVQGEALRKHQALLASHRPLVVDLYDPFLLEDLEQWLLLERTAAEAGLGYVLGVLLEQVQEGDYFLCASERQRDFWLGMLMAAGRLNPAGYAEDKTLGSLIGVVSFGLPSLPPGPGSPVAKGILPGIGVGDRLALWGGGIYEWLDPLTFLQGFAQVAAELPDLKVLFMGTRHPNPGIPVMPVLERCRRFAAEAGLLGSRVFFNEGWVPYKERHNYLLEADLGVSLHLNHVESRFSFRTRILDYVWAGVPVLATEGDATAEIVQRFGLGRLVPPESPEAVAAALRELAGVPDLRQRLRPGFERAAEALSWERVCQPLLSFCERPRHAPDRVGERPWAGAAAEPIFHAARLRGLEQRVADLGRERDALAELVAGYQRGRFIRTMAKLQAMRLRIFGGMDGTSGDSDSS